ncbi:hypothetical protein MTR67_012353 [Solanum verrucosum]|uniref:Integrase catalytic domain-containing protein n=1 Tax=Solanum verrucosum TaxID=315347 RepID=A0AAF0TK61_SOLVR|nr:hypothetical protein MTR67_012353 [Solanum verrucosum]
MGNVAHIEDDVKFKQGIDLSLVELKEAVLKKSVEVFYKEEMVYFGIKDVEDYAKLYLTKMVRFYGVPLSIISDRGTQFTSQFWKSFQKGLGTRVKLSTSFHSQNDGKAERTIQTMEDILRGCVIDFKDLELVNEAMEKVWLIRERLKTTQSRQKSYADVRRRDLEFDVHDSVYLKISPMKGVMRFGKKGKLSPRYEGP